MKIERVWRAIGPSDRTWTGTFQDNELEIVPWKLYNEFCFVLCTLYWIMHRALCSENLFTNQRQNFIILINWFLIKDVFLLDKKYENKWKVVVAELIFGRFGRRFSCSVLSYAEWARSRCFRWNKLLSSDTHRLHCSGDSLNPLRPGSGRSFSDIDLQGLGDHVILDTVQGDVSTSLGYVGLVVWI